MEIVEQQTERSDESLTFFHEIDPILLKYTVDACNKSVTFKWKPKHDTKIPRDEFRVFATLVPSPCDTDESTSSHRNTMLPLSSTPLFSFHILTRAGHKLGHLTELAAFRSLNAQLFDRLFSVGGDELVVLVGTHDGYLNWTSLRLAAVVEPSPPKPLALLINTCASSIVNVGTFSSLLLEENPFNRAKSPGNGSSESDNCLYAVSKSGKIYVYCWWWSQQRAGNELAYRVCVLPHFVEFALKHSIVSDGNEVHDYLVYTNKSHEIYAVRLVDCLWSVNLKATCVKRFHHSSSRIRRLSTTQTKDGSSQILVHTSLGVEALSDLISAASKSNTNNNNNNNNNNNETASTKSVDKLIIKQQLAKLCHKSNEIVNCQRRIDKLNFALKQLNQLQTIRVDQPSTSCTSAVGISSLFEIRKSFIRRGTNSNSSSSSTSNQYERGEVFVQVEFENKSLLLLETDAFYLLVCIRLDKLKQGSSYWTYRLEKLRSGSSSSSQATSNAITYIRVNITSDHLERHFYPTLVKVYLIYDVNSIIGDASGRGDQRQHQEFIVCLHQSEFRLDEFFSISDPRSRSEYLLSNAASPPRGSNLLWSVFGEFCKRYKRGESRLDDIWTCLSIETGLVKLENLFSPKIVDFLNEKKEIKLWSVSQPNETLSVSKSSDKNCLKLSMDQTDGNLSAFKQSLSDFIYFKNKFLIKLTQGDDKSAAKKHKYSPTQIDDLKELGRQLNELKSQQTKSYHASNNSIVDLSIEMDDDGDQLTKSNNKPKQQAEFSFETLFLLFKIYLTLRRSKYFCCKFD